ncbi:hypothetical protein BaRGS_00018272 [Batillaria attramentaria]|uniref:Uncharacterized protein n=1 Tax=Batillaria attramentaria TaxID=370345 RepID=A0ABD0KTS8_9CAEN
MWSSRPVECGGRGAQVWPQTDNNKDKQTTLLSHLFPSHIRPQILKDTCLDDSNFIRFCRIRQVVLSGLLDWSGTSTLSTILCSVVSCYASVVAVLWYNDPTTSQHLFLIAQCVSNRL